MFSFAEVLDMAIRLERNGERYYRNAMDHLQNPELRHVLRRLAEDEVQHCDWFMELKQAHFEATGPPDPMEIKGGELLQSIVGSQTFSLDEVDPREFDTPEGILSAAVGFEKDTILFYEFLQSFVTDPETLENLRTLIEEENQHVKILEEQLQEYVAP